MPTPMMQQYFAFKSEYEDAILFYRVGDFYEMFYDDAKTASKEIGLTLTAKDCGEGERAPMCGVPFHSVDPYIAKLVRLGHKVVICDQVEDPATAKGIVKRDVTRIVTPGTVTDDTVLDGTKNNYICSVCVFNEEAAVTTCDVSTGDIYSTRFVGTNVGDKIVNELSVYSPSEVIINVSKRTIGNLYDYLFVRPYCMVHDEETERFSLSVCEELILRQFGKRPEELGLESDCIICSCGAMISYIDETQRTDISHLKGLNVYSNKQYLEIDINSRRSLELTETMRNREKRGTLLWVLDKTYSAMGARLLRKWVEMPLVDMNKINARLDAVEEMLSNYLVRGELGELMKNVRDMERLMTKVVYGTANCKDLRSICTTLSVIPGVKALLSECSTSIISYIRDELDDLSDVVSLIDNAIVDDPPFSVREGRFVKKGYNPDVDKYTDILDNGKNYIKNIEERERERTGIPKLRVGYNKVFGYYIEISKSYTDKAPEDYVRKQTLVGAERYITDELKELESVIFSAKDRDAELEYQIFSDITEKLKENKDRIQSAANLLAVLDAICSLAETAFRNNYVRPEVDLGDVIDIREGRHPVVEQYAKDSLFVPNDTYLDTAGNKLALITGPNMAGKSTYMRQCAIICIMAQIGSFVPASQARIGIVDKVFTRVGASDDLALGQSTFMLEMNEVAYILKNATKRSLIIYDEIGRGTSTFDGMSIARAVAEYTVKKIGCKSLFATHYHELTDLPDTTQGIVNYNIAAKKKNGGIVFLRKIVKGATDDSYGIEVAKLAGVPDAVTKRATEVLGTLEEGSRAVSLKSSEKSDEEVNVTFDDYKKEDVKNKILSTPLETLTPLEALNLMYELKKILE